MRAEKFLFAASKFKLERAAMKRKLVHDFIKIIKLNKNW